MKLNKIILSFISALAILISTSVVSFAKVVGDKIVLGAAISLTGKAGSISIHHARLLHGSAINNSSSRRMMLFYELSAADSWPLVGAPSYMKFTSPNDLWKQMKSQLISGEISTCPRMENIPVRIPLPPPSDYGSIFKTQKTGNSKSAFM